MDYTLIFLTSCFLILVVFLPLARLRLTTGVWGIVIRENSDEVENIVRVATSIMLLGLFGLALVVAKVGIEALSPFLAVDQTKPFGVILGILGMLVVIVAQAQMGASWRIGIDDEPTDLCTKGTIRGSTASNLYWYRDLFTRCSTGRPDSMDFEHHFTRLSTDIPSSKIGRGPYATTTWF